MSVVLYSTRYLKIESALGIAGTLTSPRTVSIWIKRAGTAAEGTGLGREERIATFGQSVSTATTHMSATVNATDQVYAESFIATSDKSTTPATVTDTATWHHVVAQFSQRDGAGGAAEFVQCWVDGVADVADTSPRTGSSTPMAGFWIGADSGTWASGSSNLTFNGKVAYAAVFDCTLTQAEIDSLGLKTPDTMVYETNSAANLRAYWPLASDLLDSSGNGYTLTHYETDATAAALFDAVDVPTLDGSPVTPPASSTVAPLAAFYQMMRGNL